MPTGIYVKIGGTRKWPERFWAKIDKNGPLPQNRPDLGQCWTWKASPGRRYGRAVNHDGQVYPAHTLAYLLVRGQFPKDLQPDHLCENTRCVNPWHLEWVTPRVNTMRSSKAPAAINARKTHCLHGHQFNDENTRRLSHQRRCVLCTRLYQRRWIREKRRQRKFLCAK